MDDDQHPDPPPHPDDVAALQQNSSSQSAIPGDTLPVRPGVDRSTNQGLPPPPSPDAGRVMPPAPGSTHDTTKPADAAQSEDAGVQRSIENSNLDAVAQADPNAQPDRYSAEALRDIVAGAAVSVPVDTVDRELIQVWKSTAAGGDNEGQVAVTLMRAMNLVVYVEDEARAQQANEVVSRITARHPCRTIMIVNRSGAPAPAASPTEAESSPEDALEARLSAHCQLSGSTGKHVCCEQITIEAKSAAALSRVSNVALNLLITDLPVFLWWAGGAPFNNVVLTQLEDSIDRLIIDSATFSDPSAGLLAMARTIDPAFRSATAARFAPGDLNWDRLTGWREATAQLFDSRDLIASLWRIGTVEIQYAAPQGDAPPNPAQALLYAAWLATRLGWEFHGAAPPGPRATPGDVTVTMRQGVRSIPIRLRPDGAPTVAAGGLTSILMVTNDVRPTTFSIAPSGDEVFVDAVVAPEDGERSVRKVRFTVPDELGLLDTEMELFTHDAIYDQALAMAGNMAWGSLSLGRRSQISAQINPENRQGSFDPRF